MGDDADIAAVDGDCPKFAADLGQAFRDADDATKRSFLQAFEVRVEFDKTAGRIGISATVSEDVADAFADQSP